MLEPALTSCLRLVESEGGDAPQTVVGVVLVGVGVPDEQDAALEAFEKESSEILKGVDHWVSWV